jgi:glycolate oxidase FAD binding subunit
VPAVSESLSVDGFGPLPVRRASSVTDVCQWVKGAEAVYTVGGGTALDFGLVPSKSGFALDTRGLNAVVEHASRDMTVTVQAGITVQALADALVREGQWLPVDVPHPERATLGGAAAANRSGPRRFGQGTFRDYVIGISFVTDEGVEVKGGGRVVKNVAGYDLMKLMIGSLGTLGVITQLTLKVKPKPEASAIVTFGVSAAAVGPTLDRLHASASRPMAVEVLNAAAVKLSNLQTTEPWLIACGFEEKRVTVDWQVKTLTDDLKASPARDVTVTRDADAAPVWHALTHLQAARDGFFTLKANVLPSQAAEFATAAAGMHSEAAVHAHAGNGIVFVHLPTEIGVERASGILAELTKRTTANGNVTVRRCPPDWKRVLPVWGRDTGDRELMRQVKRTLDPRDVFNPGRVFGERPA